MKTKIAIFASGSGTNAEEIIKHFQHHDRIEVSLILANNSKAKVLKRAENHKIPHFIFTREMFYKERIVDELLEINKIDFIVLAGFMWLIPGRFVTNYKSKIVNIHPALLPKYGGKGMYGMNVHKAVVENKDEESGISIHYVNEKYDEGKLIFQAKCPVLKYDTPEMVAEKIHVLEYKHFPEIIEKVLLSE